MLSLKAIKDAGGASHYFSHDDYYVKDDPLVQGAWRGLGATRLGLSHKPVELDQFSKMLDGHLPNDVQLGRADGKHKPGWDLTFSAPKSVSSIFKITPLVHSWFIFGSLRKKKYNNSGQKRT